MVPSPYPPSVQQRALFLVKRLRRIVEELGRGEPGPARRRVLERAVRRCKDELDALRGQLNREPR